MSSSNRLRVSAAAAAVLFIVGYLFVVRVPGGGDVTDSDFTSFYDSDGKMVQAAILNVVLILAAVALTWCFIELRTALGGSVMSQLAAALGTLGALTLPAGAAIMAGPVGVQLSSDSDFVGRPIAQAFAQAGLGVMLLLGMGLIAVSTILFGIAIRRAKVAPSWLGIAGVALGVICLGSYIWLPGWAFPLWLLAVAAVGLGSGAGSTSVTSTR